MSNHLTENLIFDLYKKKDIERLLENEFVFSRKYDMEQCLKPISMNPIIWDYIPFDDEEWTWVFHRMEYCVDLCYETQKTGDLKYINHAKKLIFDFVENAMPTCYLRTLDTGIRIISWLKFIKYADSLNLLSKTESQILNTSISDQINHLYEHYKGTDSISNWGAIQCVAVLKAEETIMIDDSILTFFENEYYNHLEQQFYKDGMQWEQSSVYIVEVTVKLLQMTNSKYQTEKYIEVLKKVFYALYSICDNDFNTITLGDGDVINVEGILQSIAFVTNSCDLIKFLKSPKVFEEVFYLYGEQAITYFSNNSKYLNGISEYLTLLENSSLLSNKNKQSYLTFQNGPVGGGHGHSDNLHVNLSINSQPILVDSGRYSYVNTYTDRQYFKDSTAHNGFIFEQEIIKYKDSWRSFSNFNYSPITFKKYTDFVHIASSIANNKNFAKRELINFENGDLLILNSSFSDYKINYILDNSINVTQLDDFIALNDFKIYCFGENNRIEPCYISKHYNTKVESQLIQCSSINGQQIAFICNQSSLVEEDNSFSYIYNIEPNSIDDAMQMLKIKSNGKYYTIFYLPFENSINNSSIKYKDKLITGKLVIYNESEDKIDILKN